MTTSCDDGVAPPDAQTAGFGSGTKQKGTSLGLSHTKTVKTATTNVSMNAPARTVLRKFRSRKNSVSAALNPISIVLASRATHVRIVRASGACPVAALFCASPRRLSAAIRRGSSRSSPASTRATASGISASTCSAE